MSTFLHTLLDYSDVALLVIIINTVPLTTMRLVLPVLCPLSGNTSRAYTQWLTKGSTVGKVWYLWLRCCRDEYWASSEDW